MTHELYIAARPDMPLPDPQSDHRRVAAPAQREGAHPGDGSLTSEPRHASAEQERDFWIMASSYLCL